MGVLCGIMGLSLGVIVSGAYRVQVEDGAAWRELAEKQRQRRLHVEPKRGSVFDRNGQPLAVSIEVPSIVADVAEMLHGVEGDSAQTVALKDASVRLGAALSMDSNELYQKLATRRRFIWLKRRVDERRDHRDPGSRRPEETSAADPRPEHRGRGAPVLSRARAPRGGARVRRARRARQGRARAVARRRPPRTHRRGAGPPRSQRASPVRGRPGRRAGARRSRRHAHDRLGDSAPRAAGARRCDGHVRGQGRLRHRHGSEHRRAPRDGVDARVQPQRLLRVGGRLATRSSDHRSLRARLGDEDLHALGGARRGRAEADRDDQLRARHLPGRQRRHPRHAPERLPHADADPREELEHRRAEDRASSRRAGALRGAPALRFRRGDRAAAAGRSGGRAPAARATVVRRRDRERVVRSGHQRHGDSARDRDVRDRERREAARAAAGEEGDDEHRRRDSRRNHARAARDGPHVRDEAHGRDADRGHRRRRHRRRGRGAGLPRRGQDGDGAEGRSRRREDTRRTSSPRRSSGSCRPNARESSWPSCSTNR